jgi:flagellin-like hook-associated protein FlgL
MKHLHSEDNSPGDNPGQSVPAPFLKSPVGMATLPQGFAKVVAGGRIVRLQNDKPFLERMVTGGQSAEPELLTSNTHAQAVLESIASNLEAGIELVDNQEVSLAKMGGRLSEIALSLNQVRAPQSDGNDRRESQVRFEASRDEIRRLTQATYDNAALFSKGPAKPITIAVPTYGEWEGISIDRANIEQPGLTTIDHGKVYGEGPGYTLDVGSIKRAFNEWRTLCINNRMQWGLLMDRLHGANRSLRDVMTGKHWDIPETPRNQALGPLRRPHRNN